MTGSHVRLHRVRSENTDSGSTSRTLDFAGAQCVVTASWFKASTGAPVVNFNNQDDTLIGCAIEGGQHGVLMDSGSTGVIAHCAFNNTGGDAVRSTSGTNRLWVISCSVYSPASDGVELTAAPTHAVVVSSIFSECGGYGVNQSSGTNTANVHRSHQDFHSNTSGNETGFGDTPSVAEQTESASPFTNAASGDLSLLSTANAKANGVPKGFENQSYTSYLDVGAVQRQEAAGGAAGMLYVPGLEGTT
jgi:hypothetical protein